MFAGGDMAATTAPVVIFFFNDTATTEIYTLSLHDALPICPDLARVRRGGDAARGGGRHQHVRVLGEDRRGDRGRSEEHTSELQSRQYLVCRLLLEKKKSTALLFFSLVAAYMTPSAP